MSPLLDVKGLTIRFGGLVAVDDLNFTMEKANHLINRSKRSW